MSMIPPSKACTKCGADKPLTEYHFKVKATGRLMARCKACDKAMGDKWRKANPETHREYARRYAAKNPEKVKARMKRWRAENQDRIREQQKKYRQANPEKMRAKVAAYKKRHKEGVRVRDARYREKNREAIAARHRQWCEENPDRWRAICRKAKLARRAREAGAAGSFTEAEFAELKALYDHRCLCCGRPEPEVKLTPDHIVPLSVGGSNDIDNIQPLCLSCNKRKHAKAVDYRRPRRAV